MIKWLGYLKSLKQYLFILLISCFTFGLGCFASAGYTRQIGVYGYNPFIQNFDINFTKNGNPLTQNLGYTKQLFTFFQGNTQCAYRDSTVRIYWWRYNGLPYYYIYYYTPGFINPITKQGNITNYWICDKIVDYNSSNQPGNCVESSVGESTKDIFGSFLSTLTSQDNFYFDYSCSTFDYGDNWYWNLNAPFCISNNSVGHSLCFNPGISWGGNGNLTGSAGVPFGYNFDSISTSFLQNPPSSQGNGSSSNDIDVSVSSGSVDISCTKRNALKWYENRGFTSRLCYGGLDNYGINLTGVVPIYGTGLDIEDIWFNTAGYRQGGGTGAGLSYNNYFGYWRPLYYQYKHGNLSVNPFINVPTVIFTYFSALDSYGFDFSSLDIMEYCDLKLYTSDLDSKYLGENITSVCSVSSLLDNRPRGLNSSFNNDGDNKIGLDTNNIGGKKTSSSSGSNISNFTGSGFGGSSSSFSGSSGYTNGSNFITDFFNLLDSKFDGISKSDFGLGVLPTYIIIAFIGLVLFRFISH